MSPEHGPGRRPVPVRLSVRLYRVLLATFPRPFRARFGRDVAESFADLATATWRRGGVRGLARLWAQTVADLLRQGARERWPAPSRQRGLAASALVEIRRTPPRRMSTAMETLAHDIRFAARTLRRSPGFTLAIVGTIGLGIGANTAIFAVLDAIVLRPLPFPESERVISLCETHPRITGYCVVSPPNARDWERMAESVESIGVARGWTFSWRTETGTTSISAGIATAGWFDVHAVEARHGRLIEDRDLPAGDNRVVVLTDAFWRGRFAADPSVVGRELTLDEESFRIIGILPPGTWFHDQNDAQVWAPLTATPDNPEQRDWRGFVGLGRLAVGLDLAQARQELEGVRQALQQEYPEDNEGWGLRADWLRETVSRPVRGLLTVFAGAVGFVLLIGCANVASLMLVRASERTQEFAVRASLGAGRRRIVRQLLTESLLLSGAGATVGVLLAAGATRVFLALAPGDIPRLDEVAVDPRALGFALALAVVTAVLFGLAPAWRASRTGLSETLKSQRHGDAGASRMHGALIVAEVALALTLLIGAGLMTRSFASLLRWEPGFDSQGVTITWGLANFGKYETGTEIVEMFDLAAAAIAAIPSVEAVGQTSAGPLFGGRETDSFTIEGRPVPAPDAAPTARWYDVGPRYFDALGVPIVRGRGLRASDDRAAVSVAVVNETLAARHWPDGNPIGSRIRLMDSTVEIVGVVGDVLPFRPNEATDAEIYMPKRQFPRGATYFVIRSELATASLAQQVTARLQDVDPDLRLSSFRTLEDRADAELVSPRFNLLLVALFAAVAVALASVGTYGVIAYTVAGRTHEIGVRMALGARPTAIVAAVVRSGFGLALVGMALGLVGALALGRFLSHLLFGLPPNDPVTFAAVAALFALIALVACGLPALRASRVDPMTALRVD